MRCLVAGDVLAAASERDPVVECWPDCKKGLSSFALALFAGRKTDTHRVNLVAVLQHFVMQVRAGRAAGGANIADGTALAYPGATLKAALLL